MENKTTLGILLIILAVTLPVLSFGHQYVEDLMTASTLTVTQDRFEVTPNSEVVISYNEYSTWGTLQWNFNLYGNGIDLWSPKVWIDYHETYYGSFTITAPDTPGTYEYKLKPYMYKDGTQIGHSYQKVYITVTDPQPTTYTLTVTTKDDTGTSLPNVDISLNDGPSATTDQYGALTISDLEGTYTVTGTKDGYESDSETVSMTQDQSITLTLSKLLIVCPTVYDPVCGVDGKTYSNSCYAEAASVEVDYEGECLLIDPLPIDCQTLWWYDNEHQYCQEKEFCGSYMYYGLNTFSTEEECKISLNLTTPTPTATLPIITTYAVSFEFKDKDLNPIENVKVIINNYEHFTNSDGIVSFDVQKGTKLDIIALKEGYNRFENSYTVNSDLIVKVQMADSGGNFFLNLNLKEYNPFYDPEGLFGVMPYSVVIMSILFFIGGIFMLKREE